MMNAWHFFLYYFFALNNHNCDAHVDEIFLIILFAVFNFQ
jgi:hypothetical protein